MSGVDRTGRIILSELPLLVDLSPKDRDWLIPFFHKTCFQKSEVICRQNDPEKDLYILTRGMVEITRSIDEKTFHVETLEAPTVTGEMSFIDNMPRSATVRVLEDVEALVMPFNDFQKLMVENPIISFHFLFSIGRLISARLRTTLDRLAVIENSYVKPETKP